MRKLDWRIPWLVGNQSVHIALGRLQLGRKEAKERLGWGSYGPTSFCTVKSTLMLISSAPSFNMTFH